MSFTALAPTDFVVSSDAVTAPAWSTNTPTLSTFFTASTGLVTSSFYKDVYNTGSNLTNSAVQFSVAYGNILGSGSLALNSLVSQNTPTRIIFGEYRNLIFGDAESNFNFGIGNTASIDLIAIQIDRNRYKESLFPGTFNLQLRNSAGTATINLTDDSNDVSTVTYVDGGRVYNIISGSNGSAASSPLIAGAVAKGYTPSGSYGLFLPDIGLIVLNPKAIACPIGSSGGGLATSLNLAATAAAGQENLTTIFNLIRLGESFQLNSQETISSDYIFVRVNNADYNYSTNPSFVSGSSGEMIYSNFINSPQTYPTSIGLYNNNNELLAVAKVSKPLTKDFTKEALIRVKLDW